MDLIVSKTIISLLPTIYLHWGIQFEWAFHIFARRIHYNCFFVRVPPYTSIGESNLIWLFTYLLVGYIITVFC
jgi:hypothetical protein